MNHHTVSLIVPLLAQPDAWLRQCLLSGLQQTHACEVIVVTSNDTPYSNIRLLDDMQKTHGNLHVVPRQPGQRLAGALNEGIRVASTQRVGFLLSDNWLAPDTVEACVEHRTDIVSTSKVVFCEYQVKSPLMVAKTEEKYNRLPTLEAKASYLSHFLLFSRSKLLEVGGVDEDIGLTGPDDYDLIWTLLEQGASVSIEPRFLHYTRDHSNTGRLTLRHCKDQIRDLEKILDKHGVGGSERDALLQAKARWFGRPILDVVG